MVLKNSLTNEAMSVHINSTEQEAAVDLNQNTKCEMKAALTLVLGIRSKRCGALSVTVYPLSPHAAHNGTSHYVRLENHSLCVFSRV